MHIFRYQEKFTNIYSTNNLYKFQFSLIRVTCPAHLILLDLLIYLAESINHAAPRYAVVSTLPSLHPSSVQIFSSAPCSLTPSVYVPPLMSETKFNTNIEPQKKL
jgi:hypothetical protein